MRHTILSKLLEKARQAQSETDIRLIFSTLCDTFYFDYFVYAVMLPGALARPPCLLLTNAPIRWRDRYIAKNYFRLDPVLEHFQKRITPIVWSSIQPGDDPRSQCAFRFMCEARDFGLASGVSLSIRGARGETSVLSVSSRVDHGKSMARVQRVLPVAQLLLTYVHEASMRLAVATKRADVDLTPRERECLLWAAEGKTSWEIAQILGLSERTANFHLNNAAAKLEASNRTQAVARAVFWSLLTHDV